MDDPQVMITYPNPALFTGGGKGQGEKSHSCMDPGFGLAMVFCPGSRFGVDKNCLRSVRGVALEDMRDVA